ncbi:hypothetical protein [Bacillus cereus]
MKKWANPLIITIVIMLLDAFVGGMIEDFFNPENNNKQVTKGEKMMI